MEKTSFKLIDKASVTLSSALRRQTKKLRPLAAAAASGFESTDAAVVRKADMVNLLVEADDPTAVLNGLDQPADGEQVDKLSDTVVSAYVTLDTARDLLKQPAVRRVQSKKEYQLRLDAAGVDVGLRASPTGPRAVTETGKDVLIAVIDSGFDLSHPAFRDAAGKLRVEALLDQSGAAPRSSPPPTWRPPGRPARTSAGTRTGTARMWPASPAEPSTRGWRGSPRTPGSCW